MQSKKLNPTTSVKAKRYFRVGPSKTTRYEDIVRYSAAMSVANYANKSLEKFGAKVDDYCRRMLTK